MVTLEASDCMAMLHAVYKKPDASPRPSRQNSPLSTRDSHPAASFLFLVARLMIGAGSQ
jgi:hypothetical protein